MADTSVGEKTIQPPLDESTTIVRLKPSLKSPINPPTRTPMCARCHSSIKANRVLKVLDKYWHAYCLRCSECNKRLKYRDQCYSQHGRVFCKDDIEANSAKRYTVDTVRLAPRHWSYDNIMKRTAPQASSGSIPPSSRKMDKVTVDVLNSITSEPSLAGQRAVHRKRRTEYDGSIKKKYSISNSLLTTITYPTQHTQPGYDVEDVLPEVALTSKKQEVSILSLLIEKLGMLKKLDLSDLSISQRGINLIAMILTKAISLEELHISHGFNFYLPNFYFYNITNLPRHGLFAIVNALSMSSTIKILDISNNYCTTGFGIGTESLADALGKLLTLQCLNVSHNSLAFNSVVRIAKKLRGHPNLQTLNLEGNVSGFFSECEFLMDVILSTNQRLSCLNVCGRNIRPRFTTEHLLVPYTHKSFAMQNLYLSHYLLLDYIAGAILPKDTVKNIPDDFIQVTEVCPLTSEDISSYYVDMMGGTFYNKDHNFAIVVPRGAVVCGKCVEIQATASRFGPYQLLDGVLPISSFFWVSANYTFEIPVYLLLSHHSSFEDVNEIHKVYALEACSHNDSCTTSDGKLLLNKVVDDAFFDSTIGFCVVSTNHFCSYCLGKNDIRVPDEIMASFYMYNHKGLLKAEVCMCHVNKECIEEVKRQYHKKKAELVEAVTFPIHHDQTLAVSTDPPVVSGWNVIIQKEKIVYDDFNFYKYDQPTLQALEESCCFPPRFVVNYSRDDPTVKLHSTIILEDVKVMFPVDYDADNLNGEAASTVNLPRNFFQSSDVAHLPNTCCKPDLRMLSKFKPFLHKDWLCIGFSLGISQPCLNKINKEQARSEDKCYVMFEKWLLVDSSPCYCKLISAVTHEQNLEVAEFIKFSVGPKNALTDQVDRTVSLSDAGPTMAVLNRIVVPKIKAEWEDVAYALLYEIPTVNGIKEHCHKNPKKCCQELMKDWLSTKHGASPKTWSTLLNKIREVEELTAVADEIEKKLHIHYVT